MAFVQLAVMAQLRHAPHLSGITAVGGATASGAEVAGTVGGLVGAAVGVVGLFLTIASMNAKRRREYQQEIRDAEARGEARVSPQVQALRDDLESMRADRDFFRNLAWSSHSGPLPIPPSQQPNPGGSE